MDLLSQVEYTDQVLKGLNYGNTSLQALEFFDCTFKKCKFLETRFQKCKFLDCTFEECDLSLMHVSRCTLRNVQFKHSKVVGVDWTEAIKPLSISFSDCVINYSNFMGLPLKNFALTRSVAKEVDFVETDLTGADCSLTDFSGSRFLHTQLTQADFTGATNYTINPTTNLLKKTKFSLPEAITLLSSFDIILTN